MKSHIRMTPAQLNTLATAAAMVACAVIDGRRQHCKNARLENREDELREATSTLKIALTNYDALHERYALATLERDRACKELGDAQVESARLAESKRELIQRNGVLGGELSDLKRALDTPEEPESGTGNREPDADGQDSDK